MEVIHQGNTFVTTGKEKVLFTKMSTELDIFTLFEFAALIYKDPNLKLTMGFPTFFLKMDRLQGITHKTLPLRKTLKALEEIYMIATAKIFSPTESMDHSLTENLLIKGLLNLCSGMAK